MKIQIIAIGKLKPSAELELIEEYIKKTPYKITITEIEIKKKVEPELLMKLEAEAILKIIPKDQTLIILDPSGIQKTSKQFSEEIMNLANIVFIIGGAFGISDLLKNKANKILSLGKMTFPHKLARVILLEQIYRASTIAKNHPYNK